MATGNISNNDLLGLFDAHLDSIESAFADADLIELTQAELVVHLRDADRD